MTEHDLTERIVFSLPLRTEQKDMDVSLIELDNEIMEEVGKFMDKNNIAEIGDIEISLTGTVQVTLLPK